MKHTIQTIKLLVLLCTLCPALPRAQTLSVVGTGSATNGAYVYPSPYANNYWFSKHQFFVSAAELLAAGIQPGAQISAISFYNTNNNYLNYVTQWSYAVYATSSNDPLATGMVTTGLLTTGGPPLSTYFTPVIGWNTHTLVPFFWDGISNLVVETCHAHNAYWSSNASVHQTTGLPGSSVKSRWLFDNMITLCQNTGTPGSSTSVRPNIRFTWKMATPCTGPPPPNSITGPTNVVCQYQPTNLSFSSTYTLGGLSYQWYSSTVSANGPWTPAPSTLQTLATGGQTTNAYYMAVATCSAGGSTTLAGFHPGIQPLTVDTIPYFEGFEGITQANELPNCSWYATMLGNNQGCQTYTNQSSMNRIPRSGNKFAAFYYSPIGVRYFYSNGLQLKSGITYSASLWYTTESNGVDNWAELSLMYGTSQSPAGLTSIASITNTVYSPVYVPLTNTFTVPSDGVYYLAMKAVSDTAYFYNAYLVWDDLSVTIPCTAGSGNMPALSLSTSAATVCSGNTVVINVSGADTYTWSNGSTGATLGEEVFYNSQYQVVGTNTLTGCTSTTSISIQAKPSPLVYLVCSSPTICAGEEVQLSALGALSYTWSQQPGFHGAGISVNPSISSTYTLWGSNNFGCVNTATQSIVVNPLPELSILSSDADSLVCAGEAVSLSGSGALTYVWAASSMYLQNPVAVVYPQASTVYTLTGIDENGCYSRSTYSLQVEMCEGVSEYGQNRDLSVFPNPAEEELNVVSSQGSLLALELLDLSGRTILKTNVDSNRTQLSLLGLSKGLYYLKVSTAEKTTLHKVVKH